MKFDKLFIKQFKVVILLVILSGCVPDCDFQKEPAFSLSIRNGVAYTVGYALKNNLELEGSDDSFTLPISMNDNRMLYTFQFSDGIDTLELIYDKEVQYKDECGFTLNLDSIESGPRTTFESVSLNNKTISVR